jgi:hypothetical protein
MMDRQEEGLQVIEPTVRTVAVGSRTVTVRPLTLGKLPRFLRAVSPIVAALVGNTSASSPRSGGQGSGELEPGQPPAIEFNLTELDLLDLYTQHGEAINLALTIATDITAAEIEAMELDVAVQVILAMYEVNRDFFTHKLLPHLPQLQG